MFSGSFLASGPVGWKFHLCLIYRCFPTAPGFPAWHDWIHIMAYDVTTITYHGWKSKNRGILPPKMDGENKGKLPIKMDDLGGETRYFRKHPDDWVVQIPYTAKN